jgi:hypothetical protein
MWWSSKHIKTCSKRKFRNKEEMEQEQGLKKWDDDRTEKKKRGTLKNICLYTQQIRWNVKINVPQQEAQSDWGTKKGGNHLSQFQTYMTSSTPKIMWSYKKLKWWN